VEIVSAEAVVVFLAGTTDEDKVEFIREADFLFSAAEAAGDFLLVVASAREKAPAKLFPGARLDEDSVQAAFEFSTLMLLFAEGPGSLHVDIQEQVAPLSEGGDKVVEAGTVIAAMHAGPLDKVTALDPGRKGLRA
jgi:hypothetical protein